MANGRFSSRCVLITVTGKSNNVNTWRVSNGVKVVVIGAGVDVFQVVRATETLWQWGEKAVVAVGVGWLDLSQRRASDSDSQIGARASAARSGWWHIRHGERRVCVCM